MVNRDIMWIHIKGKKCINIREIALHREKNLKVYNQYCLGKEDTGSGGPKLAYLWQTILSYI